MKSLEAFAAAADGKATKIIITSEIQNMAGMISALKEVAVNDIKYDENEEAVIPEAEGNN